MYLSLQNKGVEKHSRYVINKYVLNVLIIFLIINAIYNLRHTTHKHINAFFRSFCTTCFCFLFFVYPTRPFSFDDDGIKCIIFKITSSF